jgi:hypothetical protein
MQRRATQKTVALPSCKAELNAAVLCVQDMIYGKNLLESVGSENDADMLTKNLDGPLFKKYVEMLLGEHALGGKGGDTSKP